MFAKSLKYILPIVASFAISASVVSNIFAQEATQSASNNPEFPSCKNQSESGDKSHYTDGLHWIVGGRLLNGRDDVYSLGEGNYMQCFCPPSEENVVGDEGIQTNWQSAHTVDKPTDKSGFYLAWGPDFGLDGSWYWASGADKKSATEANFDCNPGATVSPTPDVTASPAAGGSGGSSSSSNNPSTSGGAAVLGTTNTPTSLANTGKINNDLFILLGAPMILFGIWQLRKTKSLKPRVKGL